jgi:hypothetical protein
VVEPIKSEGTVCKQEKSLIAYDHFHVIGRDSGRAAEEVVGDVNL